MSESFTEAKSSSPGSNSGTVNAAPIDQARLVQPTNGSEEGRAPVNPNHSVNDAHYRPASRGGGYYPPRQGNYRGWGAQPATPPASAVAAPSPAVDAIHVFDFDGTLFRSPTPNPTRVDAKHGAGTLERLTQPITGGGLGWFQSPLTLSHPYVPSPSKLAESWSTTKKDAVALLSPGVVTSSSTPAEGDARDGGAEAVHFRIDGRPLQTLYVEPVCAHFQAVQNRSAQLRRQRRQRQPSPQEPAVTVSEEQRNDGEEQATSARAAGHSERWNVDTLVAVMTGRDRSYYHAITNILTHAQLRPDHIFLKPHPSAGTVKYKVRTFIRLVSTHVPRVIEYYEDRLEQGAKIEAGVRFVQWLLHWAETRPPLQQLSVESDTALLECGIPRVLVEKVPPEHRRAYQQDLLEQGTLEKLLMRNRAADSTRTQTQQSARTMTAIHDGSAREEHCDDDGDGYDNGRFEGKTVPPLAPEVEVAHRHFRFVVHFVRDEWHPDSYLREDVEDALIEALKREAAEPFQQQGPANTTADFARGSAGGFAWGRGGRYSYQGRGRRY